MPPLPNQFKSKLAAYHNSGSSSTLSRKEPLWGGPEKDGITFSLLSRFLVCRERFRLLVVEGLKPKDEFRAPLEFGSMWHVCEQHYSNSADWRGFLQEYMVYLHNAYPFQRQEVVHWYEMCKALFPIYIDYWAKQPDVTGRKVLLPEKSFDVDYQLPSGRMVKLRGKWDSVDLIDGGIFLQENKTKSQIIDRKITSQLSFDLQTMLYIVALTQDTGIESLEEAKMQALIKGVRYNVVRRSAHKSVDSMLKKVSEDIEAGRAGEWFSRWKVEISPQDVSKFRKQCLDPILEQLCDWWDWVTLSKDVFSPSDGCENSIGQPVNSSIHWRHPYGVYNVLNEGGSSELDNYLETGSTVGLIRESNLFKELA